MLASTSLENPSYVEYVRLLLELHSAMAQGQGETEEADALRDAMDRPWVEMDPRERSRLRARVPER